MDLFLIDRQHTRHGGRRLYFGELLAAGPCCEGGCKRIFRKLQTRWHQVSCYALFK